jgi:hypothetical protein
VPDVGAERADQRRARDLGLERVGRAGLGEATTAVRTGVWEVGVVALGDRFGWWRRAVPVGTVGVARLATGRLRVGLGRPLAERGGLPLPGAQGLVEPPGQLGDLGFEFGDTLAAFPTAGTGRFVRADIVPTGAAGETAVPDGPLFNDHRCVTPKFVASGKLIGNIRQAAHALCNMAGVDRLTAYSTEAPSMR